VEFADEGQKSALARRIPG